MISLSPKSSSTVCVFMSLLEKQAARCNGSCPLPLAALHSVCRSCGSPTDKRLCTWQLRFNGWIVGWGYDVWLAQQVWVTKHGRQQALEEVICQISRRFKILLMWQIHTEVTMKIHDRQTKKVAQTIFTSGYLDISRCKAHEQGKKTPPVGGLLSALPRGACYDPRKVTLKINVANPKRFWWSFRINFFSSTLA